MNRERGSRRPRILLTNDDGIHAEGLAALAEALGAGFADIVVVAPDREQSACGHSLTLHRPLRMAQLRPGWYSVDGTPTDCVNLAVLWLLKEEGVDLVVSGINAGLNLGDDVTYSGTVSAALEAHLLGLPALAFSQQLDGEVSFAESGRLAAGIVERLLREEVPARLLFNVNIPAGRPRGVRLTKLGRRIYEQVVVERGDPRGRRYFWIGGSPRWKEEEGSDQAAVSAGSVSVTPLRLDLTDYAGLEEHADAIAALAADLEGVE